ncbi:MAG: (2Fe-2S) ferredoxin domain-containing protein [Planctomycetes bacterium]|nr:(2Fe-2S) ferredoxin domain-containing protein [Planctomycetota bacterium]MBL7144959.1 (2Fe-2S) ferredoxin domain-containing protein [Phycisphaerae bacterium]
MITVTVCVGSSCHVKGAREMIARFNEFLTKEGLQGKVELKGSFCMERCGEGINWEINGEIESSPCVDDGVKILRKKISEALGKNLTRRPSKKSRRRKT